MELIQGQKKIIEARFSRQEDLDLQLGKVLLYNLNISPFSIVMHRGGVSFRGTIPLVGRQGIDMLKKIFDRAIVHHEHLKATYDLGPGQQTYLTEQEVDVKVSPFGIPNQG